MTRATAFSFFFLLLQKYDFFHFKASIRSMFFIDIYFLSKNVRKKSSFLLTLHRFGVMYRLNMKK